MSRTSSLQRVVAALVAVVLCLTGCTGAGDDKPSTDPRTTLRIVAGSEQRSVLEQIVTPWCEQQGYHCEYTLLGSVDQARLLQNGSTDHDAYWFASSVFSQLGNTNGQLSQVRPMFLTPVVYAGFKPVMQQLGMVGRDVTAAEIIASVEKKTVKTWATNPTQSNSGATTLFSFLNHFAGNEPGQALTQQQLESPQVVQGMQTFVRSIERTPPSTGTMMDLCLENTADCQTMFTYEDLVIEKNLELVKQGKEPLYVVYPRGAMAISDAPFGFADHGQQEVAAKKEIFSKLQAYLLDDAGARDKLLALGRRPAGGVGLSLQNPDTHVFNPEWGIRATLREQGVTYPAAPVIESALDMYHTRFRKPVHIYYCLDGSGSMTDNGGWDGVKNAANALFDPVQARRNLLQTAPEDVTDVAVFNGSISGGPWSVTGNADGDLLGLRDRVVGHRPGGGTNMYSCLSRAADAMRSTAPGLKKMVVVMSDGKSDDDDRDATIARLTQLDVPVITIAFGSGADPDQLKEVARATGGAFVQKNDMVAALREAAGYK